MMESKLINLPAEVTLEILSNVPFSRSSKANPLNSLTKIRLVCRRFDSLLKRFESSVTTKVFDRDLRRLFPGLAGLVPSLSTIRTVDQRLRAVDFLSHSYNTAWDGHREKHGGRIFKLGLLLLYRLNDCGKLFVLVILSEVPRTDIAQGQRETG